jgi:hypothetical protein
MFLGMFAVSEEKGKLEKISVRRSSIYIAPPFWHFEGEKKTSFSCSFVTLRKKLMIVFSNLSCHLARQISPLRYLWKKLRAWILKIWFSTEPNFYKTAEKGGLNLIGSGTPSWYIW